MAEQLLAKHKMDIESCSLVPAVGGRFEVIIDGDLVFSKLQEGRFPEFDEINQRL